jgi:hypothetical protein
MMEQPENFLNLLYCRTTSSPQYWAQYDCTLAEIELGLEDWLMDSDLGRIVFSENNTGYGSPISLQRTVKWINQILTHIEGIRIQM